MFDLTAFLVFVAALLVSLLLYITDIKARIVSIAGLSSLLVFLFSLVYVIDSLARGLDDPTSFVRMLAIALLVNLYAGIFNVAARVFDRFATIKNRNAEKREFFQKTSRHLSARHAYHAAEAEQIRASGRI